MFKTITATAFTSVLCLCFAPAQAETSATLHPATAGLRIQIDENGNRVEHPVPNPPANLPAAARAPEAAAFNTAPATARPQVVSRNAATGTVVRLNGLFRAGSRATIGADGKLQSDCHVDTAHGEKGGH